MFSKKHRLAKNKDVKLTFARGRSFFNQLFAVKFLKEESLSQRFTVVVSTKVSKKAVTRNRLKRILREFVRTRLKDFASGNYAIVVKPAAVKVEETILLREFEKLLRNAKLLK